MKRLPIITSTLLLCVMAIATLLLAVRGSASAINPAAGSAGPTVTLTNFKFTPKSVTVKTGSEVTWEVKEGTHTVTADNGSFESQALSAGQKFSHQFTKPGTYRYHCSFHGSKGGHDMAGIVVVTK